MVGNGIVRLVLNSLILLKGSHDITNGESGFRNQGTVDVISEEMMCSAIHKLENYC